MTQTVYEQLLSRLGEAHPAPRLTAMRRLVDLLGDPQATAPVVQIAGTNGKTSVSRMIEVLLRSHGLRTGLFTSPHLERFNERIQVDGEPVDDFTLEQTWSEISPIIEFVDAELVAAGELPVTFFEAMTALAFAVFADAPVDVMVIEVGMGGAWDATNIADASVAVFTPIDLDHTKQLGGTRAEIARTKAGILKPGTVAVTAIQHSEALESLRAAAEELGIELREAGTAFELLESSGAVGGQLISVRGSEGTYSELPLALHGSHQAENAALAIAATEVLLADAGALNSEVLADALSLASSPGRFDRISTDPLVIADAAHNPHGARALVKTLHETFPGRECAILLATLQDKDIEGIVSNLAEASQVFFVSAPTSDRALSVEALANAVRDVAPDAEVNEREQLNDAVSSLLDWVGGSDNRVGVVTGSIVFIGEVMREVRDIQGAS